MANSPTARSLAYLREQGYTVEVVERWIPGANIRKDLFGFIDLVAIKRDETLAVQTTSYSNVSARVSKISEHENLAAVRAAGWRIEVHGWVRRKTGWHVRVVDLS